ncbi:unnamed protein product [Schistosoma margrebowiei]|uniref:Uncharacterized protein n=1 Tax=Schistosoma margrebowiei TaxID=48269 RepID=A0A183LLY7_9TREM|nr:unnamed protein product [Schistosoma margrebowiei]
MGRRFICDYCDKSFPDNPINRRNHLKGVQHQQARKLHYDKFLDPKEKLIIEKAKKPCITFRNSGTCTYGPLCKYSHITIEEIRILEEKSSKIIIVLFIYQNLDAELLASSYLNHLTSELNIDNQINILESKLISRRDKQSNSGSTQQFHIPEGIQLLYLPPSLSLH